MQKIEFGGHQLTALEVREPLDEACQSAAKLFDLYAAFDQPQQIAFVGLSRGRNRQRIGNGKQKAGRLAFNGNH